MRRTIIVLAVCAPLLVALPAQAAAPKVKDPVRALKGEFVAGHGVRFTETTTLSGEARTVKGQSRKGTFQFDAKGIAASDTVATSGMGRERVINVGKVGYTSGGSVTKLLPEGKTWYKSRDTGGAGGYLGQAINPAEPRTLAALIKKGKVTERAITGKITFKELDKVSPWATKSAPLRVNKATKVSYTLTLTSAGLVSRVKSSYVYGDKSGMTVTVDSRFTGWGTKVSIKAPKSATVTGKLIGEQTDKFSLGGPR